MVRPNRDMHLVALCSSYATVSGSRKSVAGNPPSRPCQHALTNRLSRLEIVVACPTLKTM
ncbi:hypothetical protein RchiOBHm_Chr5g0029651 [Rosa chinensis]|uniref:Uncharacterized protein n=1 Tax=Rosa chinensis TaxID=74649 RepID=A0A2P6Q9P6_ROSCH|nr:hypothetical protein RchiOBHm_Chr5g0029651 [Rosa chinensis]